MDAVTGQARYSLSEHSLLRESVDAHPLTVLVPFRPSLPLSFPPFPHQKVIPLDGFDQAPVPVRALDCDTVTQLKAKLLDTLYRNTPFSLRIGADQFDLGMSVRAVFSGFPGVDHLSSSARMALCSAGLRASAGR